MVSTRKGSIYSTHSSEDEDLMNNLGQVCQWARDQNGSRTVQNILEGDNELHKDAIFTMIFPESRELIKDRFGNYVFQKLFEKGLPRHQKMILNSMKGSLIEFSEHAYGCRVVQKAIESIAKDQT